MSIDILLSFPAVKCKREFVTKRNIVNNVLAQLPFMDEYNVNDINTDYDLNDKIEVYKQVYRIRQDKCFNCKLLKEAANDFDCSNCDTETRIRIILGE